MVVKREGAVPRQASLPLAVVEAVRRREAMGRGGSILKASTSRESRSVSRNSSRSTKTIRFQRQSSFDHGSSGYDDPGAFLCGAVEAEEEEEEEEVVVKRGMLLREPSSFTADEIMSLQAAFAKLDCNGDGQLSHAEVQAALGEMMPEEDVEELLQDMDADGDGTIDYSEFLTGMKKKVKEPESVKMLKEAFKVFDATGSGLVSRDTMRVSFLSSGNSSSMDVDEMLAALDTDNDGHIELDDFLRIFVETPAKPEAEVQGRCAIL